jgi:hypothetical protein
MTRADVDTYFYPNNHVKAYSWRKYSDDEKDAAFAQAVRELQVTQGRDLVDPQPTDIYRDDYATAEQCLFILENSERQGAEGVPQVIDLAHPEEKPLLNRKGVLIAPEALRYFGINRLKMVRG